MKRALFLILSLALLFAFCVPALAYTALLSPQNLTVDGKGITCEKYNIDGSNYFKLRDIAYLLKGTGSQFSVGWDDKTNTVSIETGQSYAPNGSELIVGEDKSATAVPSAQTITINGQVNTDLTVYNLGGNNFFKLRDLGTALGFAVEYDSATNTAIVKSAAAAAPTMGEKNALAQAKTYLKLMPFSRVGLIEQLEYEGYTQGEAVYGADHCGADWYEQAILQAAQYLETMPFSEQGLTDQLKYEGYTYAEAIHGVERCGADWYEQAARQAAQYLDFMSFSKQGLIEQLEYEGFTHAQAVYGAEQNGY